MSSVVKVVSPYFEFAWIVVGLKWFGTTGKLMHSEFDSQADIVGKLPLTGADAFACMGSLAVQSGGRWASGSPGPQLRVSRL